ncbi:transcription elongation protein SprT [Paraburkholderia sp. BR10936]|uniref:transcription elongation protein SprT n=1 Tax=Paraburkholderia sp. BR10936 TaxID=3236993 RepID=UPI0034D155F8
MTKKNEAHVVTSGKQQEDNRTRDLVENMNRESWLNNMAAMMAPRFAELGHALPPFRVSLGWSSSGMDAPVTGECWSPHVSADNHYEIFLSPRRSNSAQVACTLAHELTHAAAGLSHGHKGDFAKIAMALGFQRPLTEAQQPAKLMEWVQPMIDKLGPFPHAEIRPRSGVSLRKATKRVKGGGVDAVPVDPDADPDEGESGDDAEPANNKAPKQSTRMIKCECPMCHYIARTSQKWIDEVGPPHCPLHGAMEVAE